jgi:methyl-accepting chemotaxis protein
MMLKEIKEISSDSIRLLTEFGSPGMIRSLQKVKEIVSIVQEITEYIEEPRMANSIEHVHTAYEAMQQARDRLQTVAALVNETGLANDTTNLALSVKSRKNSESNQNFDEMINAFKDLTKSFKILSEELRR